MANVVSIMTFSKRSMGKTSLESDADIDKAREFTKITEELAEIFGMFNLRDFIPAFKWLPDMQGHDRRMQKVRIRMDSIVSKIIDEHLALRKNASQEDLHREKDMVDVLLDEMDENKGYGISQEMLKGTMWNAFSAGIETTTTAVEWIMAEVCRNPNTLNKAQAELDAVVGLAHRVQESDLPKLKYLQAIIREGFRLHPPAPLLVPHQSTKASKAFGYDIPAQTRLFVNVWAIGRDAKIWSDPLAFHPERFLDGAGSIDFQGQNFELLPFGSGRRSCPGLAMATVLTQSVVANLLQAFSWRMADQKMDMTEAPGITIHMAVPFAARAEARLPLHLHQ